MNGAKNIQEPTKKAWSIGVVVQRIFGFPFFAALAFVGAMAMWLS